MQQLAKSKNANDCWDELLCRECCFLTPVDCTGFAAMRNSIRIFTFDAHFDAQGFVRLPVA